MIIPTYNRSAWLERTLDSVCNQTMPVHQVVLVDDGSTDDTPTRVEQWRDARPAWRSRLEYLRQSNRGKSAALNAGVAAATGDWIAYNDSDDRWHERKLERQFEALARCPAAAACCTDVTFTNNPRFTRTAFEMWRDYGSAAEGLEPDLAMLFATQPWPGIYMQTVVVRADVLRQIGEFDASLRMSVDLDVLFRLGLVTPMCFVNAPLVDVDRTEARTVGLTTEHPVGGIERLTVHERLLTRWIGLAGQRRALAESLRAMRSAIQSALANEYLRRGATADARAVMTRAVRQRPRPRLLVKCVAMALAPGLIRGRLGRGAQDS